MIIVGIDPGKSGAIAIWNKGIDKVIKCPDSPEKMANVFSTLKTNSWIDNDGDVIAYIEQVHAFPTDARSSAFKFGKNYGEWLGVLGALKIRTIYITPQKWMKYYKEKYKIALPKDKPQRKRKLKELAAKYTNKKVTLYNADAILIAVYGFIHQQEGEE
tara:strand:+ start:541 stop:1017 length:477 start_codon:yes stop_codon:yes gene_type:complete